MSLTPLTCNPPKRSLMPMTTAGNQIALGEKLYFFTSPINNTTSCLIWGHGGLLHGDGSYQLPANTTIHYYVPHGQVRISNPTLGIRGSQLGQNPVGHITGPVAIENYRLRKGVGSGFSSQHFSYHDVEQAMVDNQQYAQVVGGGWCPHVVSVRRRFYFKGKTVQLGDVINLVQQHDPNIVDFYYGACRGDRSGDQLTSICVRGLIEAFK